MKHKLLPLLFFLSLHVWAQDQSATAGATDGTEFDPLAIIGMRLADVIERFGPPGIVFTVRGDEVWQDDVVFQYAEGDFYIYRDRVWQVKVNSVNGISVGDPKQAAVLILDDTAQDNGNHLLVPLAAKGWNLMIRININNGGHVSAIYIYRPDF